MRERRYVVDDDKKARYPSPRRPPSRHREYSPRRHHDEEKYSREDDMSRMFERKYGFDRDLGRREGRLTDIVGKDRRFLDVVDRDRRLLGSVDRERRSPGAVDRERRPRFPGIVDRNREYPEIVDRDRYEIGTRRRRSPGMLEKRESFYKDTYLPSASRDREKHGVGIESPRRLYDEGLLRRDKIGVGIGSSRRSYDGGLHDGGSTSTKFQWDRLSEVTRKSDGLNEKYNIYKNDNYGADDYNITRGGREREFYKKNQHVDASRIGLAPASPNLAGTKSFFSEYEKEGKVHSHSYTLGHGEIGGVTKSYLNAGDDSSHMRPVTSRYLHSDKEKRGYFHLKNEHHLEIEDAEFRDQGKHYFEKKDEDFHYSNGLYLDKLGIEGPIGRDGYKHKKEDVLTSSSTFLKVDSEYIESSSRSKDYFPTSSSILKEGFPGYSTSGNFQSPSHGVRPGDGLVSDSFNLDDYNKKPICVSPVGSGGRFDDIKIHSRFCNGLLEVKRGDTLYPKFGKGVDHKDVGEEHGVHPMPRFAPLDSLAESSSLKQMGGDRPWDKHPSSLVLSTSNNFDAYGSLLPRSRDLNKMGSGSLHLPYEREVYLGHGPEEHNNEVYCNPLSFVEKSDILPAKDVPSWPGVHASQRKGLEFADFCSVEPSEKRPRAKYSVDNMLYEHNIGIRISSDGSGARKIYNHSDAGDDVGHTNFLIKPIINYRIEKTGRKSTLVDSNKRSSSRPITNRLSGPEKSGSSNIKKRLGPIPRKLHVSQRIVKKNQPGIKRRSSASKKHSTLPWLRIRSSNIIPDVQNDVNENFHDRDGDRSGEYFRPAGPEPPELSEDFKLLVQSAFLKFLKQINETTGKRKEYMEHGKDGSLKCIVCGRNSNRFVDTEALAMHAFTFQQIVGLRSQHLGLHKALCVLMGWKIAEKPSSDWHCEVMSNTEASALKEDLIIWPPVIIVHNYSIDGKKSDGRIIVSTETLDAKLRGMGFGNIIKVSNGKPTNQSVMMVKFNGTLSGLQEAGSLHQMYTENKHGRVHLKELMSGENASPSGGIEGGEDCENFLYGYLGIAEDLCKLDFDTKKRCVVRSKNEILTIANTS